MELGFAGDEVSSVRFDYAVSLTTLGGFEVSIQTPFDLETLDGRRANIDPEVVAPELLLVLSALHQTVSSCIADSDGTLTVAVADLIIRVVPDGRYEAWTVSGPGGYKVVCTPGGELAVWSAVL